MDGQRLGDDFADAQARMERSKGILKDHLHAAALGTQFVAAQGKQVAVLE
jgi:hypothetical protein